MLFTDVTVSGFPWLETCMKIVNILLLELIFKVPTHAETCDIIIIVPQGSSLDLFLKIHVYDAESITPECTKAKHTTNTY